MKINKFFRDLFEYIKRRMATLSTILGAIGVLGSFYGYISKVYNWSNKFFPEFFKANYLIIWLTSLSLISIALFSWIYLINKKFIRGFSDNFRNRLNSKWDFVGPWRTIDDNILIVTGSDEGGITKNGADWENYTFCFKAKVITSCIGIIVRAQDLNNYYMLQIGQNYIIPYRRISYPKITDPQTKANMTILEYQIGWIVYDQIKTKSPDTVNDWFIGRIDVKGQSVSLYVNNLLVFQRDSFLMIPKGKVGFRCSGSEQAFIENVRVRLNI